MTLTDHQRDIIKFIRNNPKCTIDELSTNLNLSQSYIIRTVHILVAKGAIYWDKTFTSGHRVFIRLENMA